MGMSAHGAILQNMKMEYTGNTVRFHPAEVRAIFLGLHLSWATIGSNTTVGSDFQTQTRIKQNSLFSVAD